MFITLKYTHYILQSQPPDSEKGPYNTSKNIVVVRELHVPIKFHLHHGDSGEEYLEEFNYAVY